VFSTVGRPGARDHSKRDLYALQNDNSQFCHNCRMNLTGADDDLTSSLWMHYGELHTLSRFHSFKHM